jgi:PAS domain S-box-containing protein
MGGRTSRLTSWQRYGAAILSVAVAILARWLLKPVLGTQSPYLLQFLAVLISARYFGFGPAVAGLVLASAPLFYNAAYHPRNVSIRDARFWISMGGAYGFCLLLVWVLNRQRGMRTEVESSSRLAGERLEQLGLEVEQREREQRFSAQLRAIVESSEDAIISKDLNGVIQSWNYGAEAVYQYSAEEMIGKPIALLVPADRQHEESDIIERIRHGGRVKHFETVRLRKDGRPIQVSLTISPIRNQRGEIVGASHISRDITEHKELEQQLRQTQKLESLGVLAGGLAHDFNNLLTGIMGSASLAQDEVPADSTAHGHIGDVLAASDRAALLVRQMLAYAGKGRFVVEQLNLGEQVAEILPLIRTSIPAGVEVRLRLADDLPPIEGDASQMQQLIMNLTLNAAEAVGARRGTVTITAEGRETDAERQVVLQVQDTGCGMDEETRARIFDPFFTTKFTGRGLGLAAVLGIIRGHRGCITVESTPGGGSTFTVVLPAATPREAGEPADPPETDVRGYGLVLVVDDEELVRKMARFTLERCGYVVETAESGEAAMAVFAARAAEFDLVLLDLTMPALDGEQTLKLIRSIRPDTRIILSSGFNEGEALRRFRDSGLAGFLQKPYTAMVLARKVKQALAPAPAAGVSEGARRTDS